MSGVSRSQGGQPRHSAASVRQSLKTAKKQQGILADGVNAFKNSDVFADVDFKTGKLDVDYKDGRLNVDHKGGKFDVDFGSYKNGSEATEEKVNRLLKQGKTEAAQTEVDQFSEAQKDDTNTAIIASSTIIAAGVVAAVPIGIAAGAGLAATGLGVLALGLVAGGIAIGMTLADDETGGQYSKKDYQNNFMGSALTALIGPMISKVGGPLAKVAGGKLVPYTERFAPLVAKVKAPFSKALGLAEEAGGKAMSGLGRLGAVMESGLGRVLAKMPGMSDDTAEAVMGTTDDVVKVGKEQVDDKAAAVADEVADTAGSASSTGLNGGINKAIKEGGESFAKHPHNPVAVAIGATKGFTEGFFGGSLSQVTRRYAVAGAEKLGVSSERLEAGQVAPQVASKIDDTAPMQQVVKPGVEKVEEVAGQRVAQPVQQVAEPLGMEVGGSARKPLTSVVGETGYSLASRAVDKYLRAGFQDSRSVAQATNLVGKFVKGTLKGAS